MMISENEFSDYYKLLGIEFNASSEEIRKAYISLVIQHHPDKFNCVENSEIWFQANEFVKNINAAYSVLSNKILKNNYDKNYLEFYNISLNENKSDDKFNKAGKTENDPKSYEFYSKKFNYNDIPTNIREKLLNRQNSTYVYKLKLSSATGRYVWSFIMLIWFPFAYGLFNIEAKDSTVKGIALVGTIGILLLYLRNILFLVEWHRSKIKCNFLITPLYFIKTEFSKIEYWHLWELQGTKITDNYVNGMYSSSTIIINFTGENVLLMFYSKKEYKKFFDTIDELMSMARTAFKSGNIDYIRLNDDFFNFN